MNAFGLRFHHFGWIVPAPEKATSFLVVLGYVAETAVFDPLQQVNLRMMTHASMPDVELIWPGPGDSPVTRLLRRGHMIYHACYVTDDAEASLAAMAAAGQDVLPVSPAQPAILFGGVKVSFHAIDEVGLIELIHGMPGKPGV